MQGFPPLRNFQKTHMDHLLSRTCRYIKEPGSHGWTVAEGSVSAGVRSAAGAAPEILIRIYFQQELLPCFAPRSRCGSALLARPLVCRAPRPGPLSAGLSGGRHSLVAWKHLATLTAGVISLFQAFASTCGGENRVLLLTNVIDHQLLEREQDVQSLSAFHF